MSNIITINQDQLVTTTLAIAQGTDNDHASVIKLVRAYQGDLEEFGLLDFKSESSGGRPTEYAELNEQQATLILTYMRNSDVVRVFKKRLVKDFWDMRKKLETRPALTPANLTRLQLLEMAMQSEQERLALESKVGEQAVTIAAQAPKVEALDRIATAEGMFNLQNAGKMLQQRPNKFIQKLREIHWIFKRPGAKYISAHVEKINSGYLTTKAHEYERPDGTLHVNEQVMVTPKGLAKLALMLGVEPPQQGRMAI